MSNESNDRSRVVGLVAQDDARRPGGARMLVAGLVVGLAVGVLFTQSSVPSSRTANTTEPPAPAETTPSAGTTDSTMPVADVEQLQARIEVLESELAETEDRVLALGLDADPATYATALDCDASVGDDFDDAYRKDSYFVGPVGFYRLIEILATGESTFQVLAGVEEGDSVTLVVPVGERDSYSLLWNSAIRTGDGPASGGAAVTLGACPGATLFVGGFAIERSAYCAPPRRVLRGQHRAGADHASVRRC